MSDKNKDKTKAEENSLNKENKVFVFCDGGARGNPGPAAIGFVVKGDQGKILAEKGEYIGRATNNIAEYQGVIKSLNWLIEYQTENKLSFSKIQYYLDSQLVVKQLNGLYKVKNANLRDLVVQIRGLENQVKGQIIYFHIPREKNYQADELLNQALNKQLQ